MSICACTKICKYEHNAKCKFSINKWFLINSNNNSNKKQSNYKTKSKHRDYKTQVWAQTITRNLKKYLLLSLIHFFQHHPWRLHGSNLYRKIWSLLQYKAQEKFSFEYSALESSIGREREQLIYIYIYIHTYAD